MRKPYLPPLRVLLVDDCPDVCLAVGTLLRLWGHEVRTEADGPSALTAAGEYHPHVVLLDVGLPGMSGYEVARRLRGRPGEFLPRLVTISGHGLEEDFLRSRAVGCDRHLVKPVDLADLRRLLAAFAERVGQEDRAAGVR